MRRKVLRKVIKDLQSRNNVMHVQLDRYRQDNERKNEEIEALRDELWKANERKRRKAQIRTVKQAAKAKTLNGQLMTGELMQDMARAIVELQKRAES